MKSIKLFESFSFRKLLYNKRFSVTFSLVAAFVLWLVIMISQNPDIERSFTDVSVNINLENTYVAQDGMEIIGDLSSQKFTVTVNGPSYVVTALSSSDVYVYASAAEVSEPGTYQLNVIGAKNNTVAGYEIVSVTPATVDVVFDYVETKEFTVKAEAVGVTATQGLIAETPVVSGTENDTVTVKGPRTVVNKIDSVVAYTEVNSTLSASETFNAEIRLYDENGTQLPKDNLSLSVNDVKVTVSISKRVTVPVVAEFTNLPSGFEKDSISYTIDHDSVSVIGTPATIDKITKISLSPIDITGLSKAANSFEVSAKLPDGVRLLDSIESFVVTVDLDNYAERTVTVSEVKFSNLASGLSAAGTGEIKNVKICGPKNVVNRLSEDELYALADLTDKTAGEHTVAVTVTSGSAHTVWQVGSYNTTVKIQ